jgi:hypothetical protein
LSWFLTIIVTSLGWDVGCMTMKKGEVAELTVAGPQVRKLPPSVVV